MQRERRVELESRPRLNGEAEPPIGDLLRQLAGESSHLLRQEVDLARLELKETTSAMAKDAVKIAVAIGLLVLGGLALTACLVLLVGLLLGGAFWAGALIIGALCLLVGGLMARSAISNLKKRGIKPDETIETLREDTRWLQREAKDFKRATLS